MAIKIYRPTLIKAAGEPPKRIEEFFGRVNSQSAHVSIARMTSPSGWREPGQTPEFDEYSVVTAGCLHVEFMGESVDVQSGEAILVPKGTWVRYSTPGPDGAEYLSVCLPAFSPDTVHRDSLTNL